MSNYWWGFNRNRREIGEVHTTIKFKTLFPDFKTWKAVLVANGNDEKLIEESDFIIIESAIGNSFLRYSTGHKNNVFIGYKYKYFYSRYLRQMEVYNKSIDEVVKGKQSMERKVFLTNRGRDGEVDDNFLTRRSNDEIENTQPIINVLKQVMDFQDMEHPKNTFLVNLIGSIVRPLQPNQRGTEDI